MKRMLFTGGALAALAALAACGQADVADAPAETAATQAEVSAEAPDADAPAEAPTDDADAAPERDQAEAPTAPVIDLPTDASPAVQNLAMSQQFLAANAQRDEVQVTDSGLQYEVLTEGPDGGTSPSLESWVCVDYTGLLPDGAVFDSTEGAQPIVLPLNGIIDGWREALPMMGEGDTWRLFIPPELGYGPSGAGNVIPPNAALVFDIALLRVLQPTDLAVLPDGRVDRSWNCAEASGADQ